MIAIIDYGMGNLRSVSKAFEAVGHQAVVTRDPRVIGNASHVVLPGVGAFGDCMANVERYGLAEPIRTAIQSETTGSLLDLASGHRCFAIKPLRLGACGLIEQLDSLIREAF